MRRCLLPLLPSLFATAFMSLWIWLRWPLWETAFRSDGSPVAWLSSAQLIGATLLALRLGRESALSPSLAAWLCVGLLWLSLDEQFQFHEHWKYGCEAWFVACKASWVREIPTLAIGFFGLPTAIWLHRVCVDRDMRILLWTSIIVGFAALAIDQLLVPPLLAALEEGFEVLAEALFVGALLTVSTGQRA